MQRPQFPSMEDRLRGSILGALAGDAFCLGTHWTYNVKELEKQCPDGPRGFERPREGHYHGGKEPGDFTHYGDAAVIFLESVADRDGVDPVDFGRRFLDTIGAGDYPGYRDSATRGTLDAYQRFRDRHPDAPYDFQQGADDDQLATAGRIPAVVAAHFGDPSLSNRVGQATRVLQNHPRAIAYMLCHARVLVELLAGRDIHSAFHRVEELLPAEDPYAREALDKIRLGFGAKHLSTVEATLAFGQSCPLICSFPSAVQAAAKYPDAYARAIRETAAAGGDNAGRCLLVGSWLGAAVGVSGIPRDWIERLRQRARIERALDRLLTPERLRRAEKARRGGLGYAETGGVPAGDEEAILSLARRILSEQEGLSPVQPAAGIPALQSGPFTFVGRRDGRRALVSLVASPRRLAGAPERLKQRLIRTMDAVAGAEFAVLQLRCADGAYRLWWNQAIRHLPDGFSRTLSRIADWVEADAAGAEDE